METMLFSLRSGDHMTNTTKLINTIRYNANQILVESWSLGATVDNYDYLINLAKRLDEISGCITLINRDGDITNEPVCNTIVQSVHKAMIALIPSVPMLDFDFDGEGEDLSYLVSKAFDILQACDEDGMAMGVSQKFYAFGFMCSLQAELDEQWLTDLAND
jgi:hypothetical protein